MWCSATRVIIWSTHQVYTRVNVEAITCGIQLDKGVASFEQNQNNRIRVWFVLPTIMFTGNPLKLNLQNR